MSTRLYQWDERKPAIATNCLYRLKFSWRIEFSSRREPNVTPGGLIAEQQDHCARASLHDGSNEWIFDRAWLHIVVHPVIAHQQCSRWSATEIRSSRPQVFRVHWLQKHLHVLRFLPDMPKRKRHSSLPEIWTVLLQRSSKGVFLSLPYSRLLMRLMVQLFVKR